MKLAAVLALLTFLFGAGLGLYGESRYESIKSEIDRSRSERQLSYADPLSRFGTLTSTLGDVQRMHDAERTRNIGIALAFGGPFAIWLLALLWQVAFPKVQKGAMQGAKVGRMAVDELSKRSARATKDVVGAVAQLSDNAQGRTRECPFCAEMIKPQAKVCRHCGKDVA